MKHTALLSAGTPLLVAAAAVFALGDLNPPAGSVTATGKRLAEIEPRIAINATNTPGDADSVFKVTQPGSYYVTDNITGVVSKHGIEIASSGVSLDLNGFEILGVSGMGSFDGVFVSASGLRNLAVYNGSVRAWGGDGIDLTNTLSSRAENVAADGNVGVGIRAGTNSVVSVCTARGNGIGIQTSSTCLITQCRVQSNLGNGISTDGKCTITGCSAESNGANGIVANSGTAVETCTASANQQQGIFLNSGSVYSCVADNNFGNGISVLLHATVANCTTFQNALNGITAGSRTIIVGNSCSSDGFGASVAAGIAIGGNDNRVEDNNCVAADLGIDVNSSGNIILRNTCSGNTTNWDIVANNVCGPILDRTAPASAAILGNSAASSLGTTDANANFSY